MPVKEKKDKFSILDAIACAVGILVTGFIVFILIWPLIDPTPERSATIQENIESLGGK